MHEMHSIIKSFTMNRYQPLWLAELLNGRRMFISDAPILSFKHL